MGNSNTASLYLSSNVGLPGPRINNDIIDKGKFDKTDNNLLLKEQ